MNSSTIIRDSLYHENVYIFLGRGCCQCACSDANKIFNQILYMCNTRMIQIISRIRFSAFETLRKTPQMKTTRSSIVPTFVRCYHKQVVNRFSNPKHAGSFSKDDSRVGTGLVGAPACGDVMKLQIRLDPTETTIESARFKTFGCGSAIASSDLACEWIEGKTLHEALSITNVKIARHLKLPPVKLHCSMLAEDAIRSAIRNFHDRAKHL